MFGSVGDGRSLLPQYLPIISSHQALSFSRISSSHFTDHMFVINASGGGFENLITAEEGANTRHGQCTEKSNDRSGEESNLSGKKISKSKNLAAKKIIMGTNT